MSMEAPTSVSKPIIQSVRAILLCIALFHQCAGTILLAWFCLGESGRVVEVSMCLFLSIRLILLTPGEHKMRCPNDTVLALLAYSHDHCALLQLLYHARGNLFARPSEDVRTLIHPYSHRCGITCHLMGGRPRDNVS